MIYWVEKSVVESTNISLGFLFKEIRNEAISIVRLFLPNNKPKDSKEMDLTASLIEQNKFLLDAVHEPFFGVEKIISRSILKLSDAELKLQKEQLLAEIDACLGL